MTFDIFASHHVKTLLNEKGYALGWDPSSFEHLSEMLNDAFTRNQRNFKKTRTLSHASRFEDIASCALPALSELLLQALKRNCPQLSTPSHVYDCIFPLLEALLEKENVNLGNIRSPLGRSFGMELSFFQSFQESPIHNQYLIHICEYFHMDFPPHKDADEETLLDHLALYPSQDVSVFLEHLALNHPHVFLQEEHKIITSLTDADLKDNNPNIEVALALYDKLLLKDNLFKETGLAHEQDCLPFPSRKM